MGHVHFEGKRRPHPGLLPRGEGEGWLPLAMSYAQGAQAPLMTRKLLGPVSSTGNHRIMRLRTR
jgi:hypothetical protein